MMLIFLVSRCKSVIIIDNRGVIAGCLQTAYRMRILRYSTKKHLTTPDTCIIKGCDTQTKGDTSETNREIQTCNTR